MLLREYVYVVIDLMIENNDASIKETKRLVDKLKNLRSPGRMDEKCDVIHRPNVTK